MRAAKINYIYVDNIAYKVINGFTERIDTMELEDLTKEELKLLRAILYSDYLTDASIKEQEAIQKAINAINYKITRL